MPKRILIVDDDAGVRKAFRYALADEGYELEFAASGSDALVAARTRLPDLIFLDLRIPEMDGVEVLRRLHNELPPMPVYIVTGFRQEYLEQLRRARDDGLRFEIADKPLNDEQIRQIARGFLNRVKLSLFYAGDPEKAGNLMRGVQAVLAQRGVESQIELIDVLDNFERAVAANVFATPMLIRHLPEPERRVLGDLTDAAAVLNKLGLGR